MMRTPSKWIIVSVSSPAFVEAFELIRQHHSNFRFRLSADGRKALAIVKGSILHIVWDELLAMDGLREIATEDRLRITATPAWDESLWQRRELEQAHRRFIDGFYDLAGYLLKIDALVRERGVNEDGWKLRGRLRAAAARGTMKRPKPVKGNKRMKR